MGPDKTFEENAVREMEEEMGICIGSDLAPQQPEASLTFGSRTTASPIGASRRAARLAPSGD